MWVNNLALSANPFISYRVLRLIRVVTLMPRLLQMAHFAAGRGLARLWKTETKDNRAKGLLYGKTGFRGGVFPGYRANTTLPALERVLS
jgi:hypothetical protein